MSIQITIHGLDKLAEKPGKLIKALSVGMRSAAFLTEAEAKKALTVGPTRAIDTGRLRADTIVREVKADYARIEPYVNYAVYVHEGTSRMRPRPFLEVAAKNAEDKVKIVFEKLIEEALK